MAFIAWALPFERGFALALQPTLVVVIWPKRANLIIIRLKVRAGRIAPWTAGLTVESLLHVDATVHLLMPLSRWSGLLFSWLSQSLPQPCRSLTSTGRRMMSVVEMMSFGCWRNCPKPRPFAAISSISPAMLSPRQRQRSLQRPRSASRRPSSSIQAAGWPGLSQSSWHQLSLNQSPILLSAHHRYHGRFFLSDDHWSFFFHGHRCVDHFADQLCH
jgi:hypothetical protein